MNFNPFHHFKKFKKEVEKVTNEILDKTVGNTSIKTYLELNNDTPFNMKISISNISDAGWSGNSRPDENFNNVSIPSSTGKREPQEIKLFRGGLNPKIYEFNLKINFSNESSIDFTVNQRDGVNPVFTEKKESYNETNGVFTVHHKKLSETNYFKITYQSLPTHWMKNIPDNTLLTEMSIPGTHDSISRNGGITGMAKCQKWTIGKQLKYGVRYLDIRMKAQADKPYLKGWHGDDTLGVEQDDDFYDVLYEIKKFLNENSSETVILQLKQECSEFGHYDFAQRVFRHFVRNDVYRNLFYISDKMPKLKDCRGKIVLINRFVNDIGFGYNIYDWDDDTHFDKDINQDAGDWDKPITATYKNTKKNIRYFFSGTEYCKYSLKTKKIVWSWHNISKYFDKVDKPIIGVVEKFNKRTSASNDIYFFSDKEFCCFDWKKDSIDSSGWQPITTKWPTIDKPITAVFRHPDYQNFCFISGNEFCLYNRDEMVNYWQSLDKWVGPELFINKKWSDYNQQSYSVQDDYNISANYTVGYCRDGKMKYINKFFNEMAPKTNRLKLCFCSCLGSKQDIPIRSPYDMACGGDGINDRVLSQHLKSHNWHSGVIIFDFINDHSPIEYIIKNNF
jgi:hypothetical protein